MFNVTARTLLRTRIAALPSRSALKSSSRSIITLVDHKYTAHAVATGKGRNGHVESSELKLDLATPKELGGTGKGQNPEQLFAMGYSSCLLGAIQLMAGRLGKNADNAVVSASVHLGEAKDIGLFGIAVDIKVKGVDEELLKAGHEVCPYSRALGQGAVVNISRED